jgi:tetratricopeptide (TPR) repeat protein
VATLARGASPASPGRQNSGSGGASNAAGRETVRPQDADRQLEAHDSERVYQAAGDQYIYEHPAAGRGAVVVRNTLPRDIATFTGRAEELTRLTLTVARSGEAHDVIPIYAIDGMPGVGKTTLAVHAAHLLESHFPDGQLFVELRAHAPGQPPVDPATVLADLLAADGVRPEAIAAGLEARTAQWRARMAGKRVLLIMDDAEGHRQVERLLPGAAGCLVLITSRRRLAGLGSRHATANLTLETLCHSHAKTLFSRLIDRSLTDPESRAVGPLVRLCGHLPLAITILAAKLRFEPRWTVTELLDHLAATRDRLSEMHAEDIAVAAAIDLSYRNLPAARRRFFRRLGLHPGPDVDPYAGAALDGTSLANAQRHLEALYEDHLVDQPALRRYRMHDLIREYARSRCDRDPASDREQAVRRLLDYYQHTAGVANRLIDPRSAVPVAGTPHACTPVPQLSSQDQALAWLRREKENLLACVAYAQQNDQRRVIGLSATLGAFLGRTGPWPQAIALHEAAIRAGRQLGDLAAEANGFHHIGILLRRTGDYTGSTSALRDALGIYQRLDDRRREADTLNELSIALRLSGNVPEAIGPVDEALRIYHDLHDRLGQASALINLGVIRWMADDYSGASEALQEALAIYGTYDQPLGRAEALFRLGVVRRMTHDYPAATRALEAALAIYEELDYPLGQANARDNLGMIWHRTRNYPDAVRAFEQALAVHVHLGNRLGQANTLIHLSIAHRLNGSLADAARTLRQARTAYRDLRDPFGQAAAVHNLGVLRRLEGDLSAAADALEEALDMYRKLGNRLGQVEVLNDSAALRLQRGDAAGALADYVAALRLAREVSSPVEVGHALEGVAECTAHRGEVDKAARHLREALDIYLRIGAAEATRAATRLSELTAPVPTETSSAASG